MTHEISNGIAIERVTGSGPVGNPFADFSASGRLDRAFAGGSLSGFSGGLNSGGLLASFSGDLFGPAAEEAAGVFKMDRTSASQTFTSVGSFGGETP
ncbi:MAG: hypothetical protein AAFU59_11980 [Pseudomonadota bacterium]